MIFWNKNKLRDELAARAMQARLSDFSGCLSMKNHAEANGRTFAEEVSQQAYDMADAMLKAREEA